MTKILVQNNKLFLAKFKKILEKRQQSDSSIEKIVDKIVYDVKTNSDKALLSYTKKFDNFNVNNFKEIVVTKNEIKNSTKKIEKKVVKALERAIVRIKNYHKRQIPKNDIFKDEHGITLGGIWNPIESVCLYVPGGTAVYPSSLIMNAVPAIVAGVKRIVISVPAVNGKLNPLILACANLLGIDEIYKVGGAQAIAAMAYGTKKIKK